MGSFHNLLSARGVVHHSTAFLRGKQDDYRVLYPAWRRKLRKHGFGFLHEEGLCWFPFRRASNSALIPKLTALEEHLGLRKLPALSPFIVFVARSRAELEVLERRPSGTPPDRESRMSRWDH